MGIGWRSDEGSDSLSNMGFNTYLGVQGKKGTINVYYHGLPGATTYNCNPSLMYFTYNGEPLSLNGANAAYDITEFSYSTVQAREQFEVLVDNIDYDSTYGGSIHLSFAKISQVSVSNGTKIGILTLRPKDSSWPLIYVNIYYQSPSVAPSV